MAAHNYSDTAVATTLVSTITSGATTCQVPSITGFPTFPYYLTFERTTTNMEVVEVTAAPTGTGPYTLTIARGASNTTAVGHNAGAAVEHVAPASFYTAVEASLAVEHNLLVYGLAGSGFTLSAATIAGARALLIECQGGGGAGGGAAATSGTTESAGTGGQGGHYACSIVTVAGLTLPLAITVGAAGAAVSGAGGGAGGLSRVVDNNGAGTVLCSAGGGAGGTTQTAAGLNQAPISTAAASMVGDVQLKGGDGGSAGNTGAVNALLRAGEGGDSFYGRGAAVPAFSGNMQGAAGNGYGAGGSGSARRLSQTALSGGAGTSGLVLITALA
jgi:hypothetical protein